MMRGWRANVPPLMRGWRDIRLCSPIRWRLRQLWVDVELAAMAGAVLAARAQRIPVLLDGFVATAAVLPLARLNHAVLDHCRAGHVPAEAGHRQLLAELKLEPLLDLGMRLGEASGAAVAVMLLRAATACHAGMATFAEAGVTDAGD